MRQFLTSIIAVLLLSAGFAPVAEAARGGASVAYPASWQRYRAQSTYWDADEYFIRTSPYWSKTHALHPYWRNSYNTRIGQRRRITHPQFYRYLEDLYYEGALTGRGAGYHVYGQRIYRPSQTQRCYNYRVRRDARQTPPRYSRCNP